MRVSSTLFLVLLVSVTEGFVPKSARVRGVSIVRLQATIALDAPPHELDKHDHHKYLFAKARECAYSDSASPDEAKSFLRQILEFESECASGALVGDKSCDDVLELADIVAHLRHKAHQTVEAVGYVCSSAL